MGGLVGALYFLGNQLLGRSPRPAMWSDETPQATHVGMMCWSCGEVWARIVQETANQWTFQMRGCSKHDSRSGGGGSFIAPWANKFDELPPEVLAYELNLLLSKEP
jgi:hypothetical protein